MNILLVDREHDDTRRFDWVVLCTDETGRATIVSVQGRMPKSARVGLQAGPAGLQDRLIVPAVGSAGAISQLVPEYSGG